MRVLSREAAVKRELRNARKRAQRRKQVKEDHEQQEFVKWAREHAELVWHTPNARKYSRGSWEYWRSMGVENGIPDILMFCQGARIALEFKQPGKEPTVKQRAALDVFAENGYVTGVVYSAEEAKDLVRETVPVWDFLEK